MILIGGIAAYRGMPRDYDPGFTVRNAQIITQFPGASPERVEQLVTDRIEKAVQEIPELDYVESESRTGLSVVQVTIKQAYKRMRPIFDKLRRKIEKIKVELPQQVRGPFVNDEFGDVFGIVLGLRGEGFDYAEIKETADRMRNELLRLADVAKVELYGVQEERVFIEYNNARLAELGLSPQQLVQNLSAKNIIIPGGEIVINHERVSLEPTGNFVSLADLGHTIINVPGTNDLLYLQDITRIKRGYIDPRTDIVHTSAEPSIALAISMRENGNLIELGEQVKALMRRLQSQLPIGLEFEILTFQPEEVEVKIGDFVTTLIQAMAIVAVTMLLLMGLRTGLIVASLIPLTLFLSLILMSIFDTGLDQMSLASLIIALGLLVDNAIVMTESILVRMEAGVGARSAAIDSANELKVPLLTSSVTTSAAFLPIFLAQSSAGEYTGSIFKVVTITLASSWLLALTMIPLLCLMFLKVKKRSARDSLSGPVYRVYRGILIWLLRFRWWTLTVILGFFIVVMSLMQYIPNIFFPPSERSYFKAEFELPEGTAIESTEAMIVDVESHIQRELKSSESGSKGVTGWVAYIGSGGPRFVLQHRPEPRRPNYALMVINTTSSSAIPDTMLRIQNYVVDRYPDLRLKQTQIENGPPVKHPIEVRLSGHDTNALFQLVDKVKDKLRSISGTRNIDDDWGLRTKKLIVRIEDARARRAGVSSQDIALSLQTGLSGLEMTEYREGEKIIPVVLRTVAAERQDIGRLEGLNVFAQATGRTVPLSQVADIEIAWQPALVIRRDRLRTVTVSAQLQEGITASEINSQISTWLEEEQRDWPLGYRFALGGEAEESGKSQQSIAVKLPIAGLIIVMLLVMQFNSIRKPVIILLTIPLGLMGVVIGLLSAGSYFGFMTLLGIISLSGIVINNAIVLLECIKLEMDENGLVPQQAIVVAAQRRLRPILLTTATTVLGLIPLWINGGAMWEPMAIAIIFGLLFATLLTLCIVPVLYAVFFGVNYIRPEKVLSTHHAVQDA